LANGRMACQSALLYCKRQPRKSQAHTFVDQRRGLRQHRLALLFEWQSQLQEAYGTGNGARAT